MTKLPVPGRIIELMLSKSRLSLNPAIRTAIASPLTGSHPRVSVRLKTAVTSASVVENTSRARIDCRTKPSKASNQFIPH
jgi:hypothetical protein